MATGDIIAARIDPDGRALHLKLEGLSAGGTYALGAGEQAALSDRPSNVKLRLNVTSEGYSTSAVLGTIARTVYGVSDQRLPSGESANAQWIQSGSMSGIMQDGETVTQSVTGATATVVTNCPNAPLILNTVTGSPNGSDVWTGGTSGAVFTPGGAPAVYANESVKREGIDGSDLWICVALDEYIYDDCTVTLDATADAYDDGGNGNSAASSYAVTNSSGIDYTKPIVRWLTVPYKRITASTFTLEAGVYHRFATGGKPVACVQFEVTDGTNTETVTVTSMTASGELPTTGLHTAWYQGTFTSADFDDNAVLTCNVRVYPWVGDADSIVDSSATASPSLSLCDLPLFNDYDDDFGVTVVYVDQTNQVTTASDVSSFIDGEDITQATTGATAVFNFASGGVVSISHITGSPNSSDIWTGATSAATFTPTSAPVAQGSDSNTAHDISNDATASANPMATIGAALVAIQAYNNSNRSRNNCDAGIVYLKRGAHQISGSVSSATANTWVTITRASGVADGEAYLQKRNNVTSARPNLQHMRYYDVDVSPRLSDTAGNGPQTIYGPFNGGQNDYLWLDSCRITSASLQSVANWPVIEGYNFNWLTHNVTTNQRTMFKDTDTDLVLLSLDNLATTSNGQLYSDNCTVGCYYTGQGNVIKDTTQDNCFYASNYHESAVGKLIERTSTFTHGIAIIGNVVESLSAGVPAMLLMAENGAGDCNNLCLAHNTTAGQRINWAYNTSTSSGKRTNFHAKYNAVQWFPHKYSDTNGQIYSKNQNVTYGAGHAGNCSESSGSVSDRGIWYGWDFNHGTASGFEDDQSGSGNPGGGDYRPTEAANIADRVIAGESVWPFCLDGNPVPDDGSGFAGAYQLEVEAHTGLLLLGVG